MAPPFYRPIFSYFRPQAPLTIRRWLLSTLKRGSPFCARSLSILKHRHVIEILLALGTSTDFGEGGRRSIVEVVGAFVDSLAKLGEGEELAKVEGKLGLSLWLQV